MDIDDDGRPLSRGLGDPAEERLVRASARDATRDPAEIERITS